MIKKGTFPYQEIQQLIKGGFIQGVKHENIQAGSLDLTVNEKTPEAYRIKGIFEPQRRETINSLLERFSLYPHAIDKPLEIGATYIVRLNEEFDFSELPGVFAFANPKSSAGRIDLNVKLVVNGDESIYPFDFISKGYKGELWAFVTSQSFLVKLYPGCSLLQLRFFDESAELDEVSLALVYKQDPLFYVRGKVVPFNETRKDGKGGLILGLDMDTTVLAAREHAQKVIDLKEEEAYNFEDFFEVLTPRGGSLELLRGKFYLFSTKEFVVVPSYLAAELEPIDPRFGEFRSHYAGFIDPGWEGKLTLEVRSFESGIVVRDWQRFCTIRYENLRGESKMKYGNKKLRSHYSGQRRGPRLSKFFSKFRT